jgi:hypothetical protein
MRYPCLEPVPKAEDCRDKKGNSGKAINPLFLSS